MFGCVFLVKDRNFTEDEPFPFCGTGKFSTAKKASSFANCRTSRNLNIIIYAFGVCHGLCYYECMTQSPPAGI